MYLKHIHEAELSDDMECLEIPAEEVGLMQDSGGNKTVIEATNQTGNIHSHSEQHGVEAWEADFISESEIAEVEEGVYNATMLCERCQLDFVEEYYE